MRSISTILKEEREKQGFSLDDVVKETKIRKNFIQAIEEGKFNSLPSPTYARGFVKNYANFLGIPEQQAAALLRREYDTKHTESQPKFRRAVQVSKGFSVKSARNLLILIVAVVVLSYVVFQFSFLVVGPKLELSSPKEGQKVTSNVVVVSGKTDPQATVLIDEENVYVDLSGSFRKTLYVASGEATITISAKNKFGKETKRRVVVTVE